MIDKLKAFYESIKGILIYVLTPIAFILGIIYYLVTKNSSLKNQLQTLKTEGEIDEEKRNVSEAKVEADNADIDYKSIRDAYLKEHGDKSD